MVVTALLKYAHYSLIHNQETSYSLCFLCIYIISRQMLMHHSDKPDDDCMHSLYVDIHVATCRSSLYPL